ncbi:MAG: NADH-quinone oxidoreductase subunit C [Planctomycetes bacterium]|nr:NADH-quinone oxidoreductase subunit C [Planctomycetota bacterium]
MSTLSDVLSALKDRFAEVTHSEFRGQTRVVVSQSRCFDVMSCLKNEHGFDMLVDVTCVDYLSFRDATDRFGLVYVLASTEDNLGLTIRVMLNEPELTVPSVVPLWEGANWMEREVWDMFGICFAGHPDLRRILLPEEFAAHPLRKDYPLQGRGERHNFPVLTRSEA